MLCSVYQKHSQSVDCLPEVFYGCMGSFSIFKAALHEPTNSPSRRPNLMGRWVGYSTTRTNLTAVGPLVPLIARQCYPSPVTDGCQQLGDW